MTSHNNTKWEVNKTITVTKKGIEMCTAQVLHGYNHPLLAVLFNPIHSNIYNPRLFEIDVDTIVNTDGLKYASKQQTLIKEITIPEINLEQRIEFAIRVAKLVCKDTDWNMWADNWLNNIDRTIKSAKAAADAAFADAAYDAAAANAAYAAANADAYAYAASAAYAAANTADAASVRNADKNKFNKQMIEIIESIIR